MKIIEHLFLGLMLGLGSSVAGKAQVIGVNIVGYINRNFTAGDHLFGNQLSNEGNNLNVLFSYNVPNGTTISVWDSQSRSFLTPSIFNQDSGWSIDYSLAPGVGALMHAPSSFASTFVGEVVGLDAFGGGFIPPNPPGDGTFLLACRVPFSEANFDQTIGRLPREGDSVTRLDSLTGGYLTTAFHDGDWDNGTPRLNIMEAAFFNLGLESVPEPSIWALALLGVIALGRRSWGRLLRR